jgi:hypothetical protein
MRSREMTDFTLLNDINNLRPVAKPMVSPGEPTPRAFACFSAPSAARNARIAKSTGSSGLAPRTSRDEVRAVNGRGRRFLRSCVKEALSY